MENFIKKTIKRTGKFIKCKKLATVRIVCNFFFLIFQRFYWRLLDKENVFR